MSADEYTLDERILFWPMRPGTLRDAVDAKIKHPIVRAVVSPLADAAQAVIAQMQQHELGQPVEFVREDIAAEDRAEVGKLLIAGETGISYMGRARCRICGAELGNKDLHGFGFMWPEKAEHYILIHNVWTPGCDKLLAAARSTK